jgi:hypothetical protein
MVSLLIINPVDIIMIIVGIWYGYSRPGKEDRVHILNQGIKIGLILGVVIGFFGFIVGGIFIALAAGIVGILGFFLIALRVSVIFIIGTFIGDFLEEKFKK